jgi:hypothetical protein
MFESIVCDDGHVASLPNSLTVGVQYFIRNLIEIYSGDYCNYLIQIMV